MAGLGGSTSCVGPARARESVPARETGHRPGEAYAHLVLARTHELGLTLERLAPAPAGER